MDYWASLTVPMSTPESAPVRGTVSVGSGVVKRVWVFFPWGHAGTTKVRILRYEHQVWPTNLEEWYLGDDTVIEFPEEFPMVGAPFEFILEGYNDDDTYDHTVYFRFTILEEAARLIPAPARSVEGVF